MQRKTSDSDYTKKHDLKRDARQKLFKFYMDDDVEREAYAILDSSDNAKKLVIDSLLLFVKNQK